MTPKIVHLRHVRHHWEIYFFVVPTLALIALFQYYPAASGVIHSFFRWNGAEISEYVGLGNYTDLLGKSEFWNSFRVALILGAWNIAKMIPALAVAVCIHRCRSTRLQFLYRILFVVPMVIPGLVIALIWRSFFFEASSGYLNMILRATGMMSVLGHINPDLFGPDKNPAWLGHPNLILAACVIWGFPWVGSFAVLTHLAKLQNIPKDVYEAADIDGVGWFRKFTNIELPLMMGSIYLLLVFVIIDTIKDAGMILALAGFEGGPGGVVTVPALFMIRKAFIDQQMGYACAVGIILMLVVMGLQKLSMAVMDFGSLTRPVRVGLRLSGVVVAMVLSWAGLWPLGAALLLAILPWGAIFRDIGSALSGLRPRLAYDYHTRAERDFRRATDLRRQLMRKVGSYGLRATKHGFVILVLALAFVPLALMLVVSFKTNQQFYSAPATLTQPLHRENWEHAWNVVMPTVSNSIFISTAATAGALVCAIGAAYFFARVRMPLSGWMWNAVLVLMMMPAIANMAPLFILLRDLSLLNTLSALILVVASGGQAFAVFVLRNFVAELPHDLFEAAEVDGANHFQQLRMIVVPLSGPILGTVGLMLFLGAWNEFILPQIVMRDQSQLPVMVELLRMAGEYIKYWGPLMAGYALASIPIIILFIFSMRLFVRGLTEGAIKG